MKMVFALTLVVCFSCDGLAQRSIGARRDKDATSRMSGTRTSAEASRSSGRTEPTGQTTRSPQSPPVVVTPPTTIAVHALPPFSPAVCISGQVGIHVAAIIVSSVELCEREANPDCAGYDFSGIEIMPFDDPDADLYFESSNDGYFMVVNEDTEIRDLGYSTTLLSTLTPEGKHRLQVDRSELHEGNVYVVRTWDEEFIKFRVAQMSPMRVVIEWTRVDASSFARSGKSGFVTRAKFSR